MNENPNRWPCLLSVMAFFLATIGCATPKQVSDLRSTDQQSIIGVTWEWTETITPHGRIEVSEPDRYTIRLKDNGEARIRYDCNHGGSLYKISNDSLSFGPLTATRIPCPKGSQGPVYMGQLAAVVAFFTENGFLYLELIADSGTMRFRRTDGI